ncbi:RNA polymerase sigma factor SigJ [Microbacteriaceae bacterium 4G12]
MDHVLLRQLYIEYKPLLFSVAYQMTGSVADTEDIIQDVFAKLSSQDVKHQQNMKGYLCKIVTNRCLDLMKSAKKKMEVYVGTWLPEPLITKGDPLEEIILEDEVSFALLVLFEKLNPMERAIFILREVLEYDYKEIAEIVQRKEANCRKILSRIQDKFPELEEEITLSKNHDKDEEAIRFFHTALHKGEVNQVIELLHNDIVYYADGGGKRNAAIRPVYGKERVWKLLSSLAERFLNGKKEYQLILRKINGQMGILIQDSSGLQGVVNFHIKQGKIQEIYYVANPDKLIGLCKDSI